MTQLNVRETLTKSNHHGQEKEEKKIKFYSTWLWVCGMTMTVL